MTAVAPSLTRSWLSVSKPALCRASVRRSVPLRGAAWLSTADSLGGSIRDRDVRREDDALSNVERGNIFERHVGSVLARLGFYVRRSGGPHDAGVDLIGSWRLAPGVEVPALVQCKFEAKSVGVKHLRELSSVADARRRVSGSTAPALAVFASASGFSRFALRHFAAAPQPMLLADVVPEGPPRGALRSVSLNRAAQAALPDVVLRAPLPNGTGTAGVVVLWQGRVVDAVEPWDEDELP